MSRWILHVERFTIRAYLAFAQPHHTAEELIANSRDSRTFFGELLRCSGHTEKIIIRPLAVKKSDGHQSWPASPTTNTSLVMEVAIARVRIGTILAKASYEYMTDLILEDVLINLDLYIMSLDEVYISRKAHLALLMSPTWISRQSRIPKSEEQRRNRSKSKGSNDVRTNFIFSHMPRFI